MAIKEIVEAGKYKWETADEKWLGNGMDSIVYSVNGQDDIAVMRTKKTHKRDWLDFLGHVLGESKLGAEHILVLPLMQENMDTDPEWYIKLRDRLYLGIMPEQAEALKQKGVNTPYPLGERSGARRLKDAKQIIELMLAHRELFKMEPLTVTWFEIFIEFMATHPAYIGSLRTDLASRNVMTLDGEWVIIDPFI